MIEVYHGELLTGPLPLEFSGNACTYDCAFCFSLLNQPTRRVDMPSAMRLLAQLDDRKSFAAHLLRERRPVLLSNRTDPFSPANSYQTLPLLETLTGLGIPVAFQTRGGRGIDEALSIVGPSVWYISVNTLDEQLRSQLEPQATTIASRFDLMEKLRAAGHRVLLGLNPLVQEWMPDVEACLSRALACGVEGVWIARLHFNNRQTKNMTASERAVMTEPVISRAMKKHAAPGEWNHILDAYEASMALGLEFFSLGMPFRSDFFQPYHDTYPGKTFPTLQDWVNHCHDTEEIAAGRPVRFAEFADFFCSRLPEGTHDLHDYILSQQRFLRWTHEVPARLTYRELLAMIWSNSEVKRCPASYPSFAFAGMEDGQGGWNMCVDDEGMPYMFFSPEGFAGWWTPSEVVEGAVNG